MKTFILLFVLLGIGITFSQTPVQPFVVNGKLVIPDVMNNVNVMQSDGNGGYKSVTLNIDSFPSFPNWPKNFSGTAFEGGIFCNMDSDPELEIVYAIGNTVYAIKKDGTNVPGWPKVLSYPAQGAPAFGDIDGDGQGEIVVGTASGSSNGFIYAFKRDGTPCTGFPINHGYTTRTIVLADLDNNGTMEIITNKRLSSSGEVWVYNGNGTVYAGWPKTINHVPASSCAVGDINGDGFPEVIAESYSSLYAFDRNGNILAGFPFTMPNGDVNSYSSPVLADVDLDGKKDIIFGTHKLSGGGYVYCVRYDGTIIPGWQSKLTYSWIYGPPSVGYINGGNMLDISVGDQILSATPVDYLYAWDRTGVSLPGFPIGGLNAINDQVSLADINNDNNIELIIDDNTTDASGYGKYVAFNHDGTPLAGWPLRTTGTTFFYTPCWFDIDNNNVLDMLGGASVGTTACNLYLWNTGAAYNPSKIFTPMWQYNTRHNGVFGDIVWLGINTQQNNNLPASFKLYQNYPNPFNPATIVSFEIPKASNVNITIYNAEGKRIENLINSSFSPGTYQINWNAAGRPSGIYFYRIVAGEFSDSKKMILVK